MVNQIKNVRLKRYFFGDNYTAVGTTEILIREKEKNSADVFDKEAPLYLGIY